MKKSKMKKVTRNNLLIYISWKKEYIKGERKDKELLNQINDFTINVINNEKRYFGKLTEYCFTDEELDYLLY